MELPDVGEVTGALRGAGVRHWLAGGWGVDALVGRQTRPHRDLDLAVDAVDLAAAVAVLADLGYAVETDWLPVRLELAARGELAAQGERWVDLHPVVFDAHGDGEQAGLDGSHVDYPAGELVVGSIEGHALPCISLARQRAFHSGYPLRPQDEADLAELDRLLARG